MNQSILKPLIKSDFCVLGAGSGGLSFAAGAAQMGASVTLLEKNKMGGDCLNYGCVPSKALLAASHFGAQFQKSRFFGWEFESLQLDYKKVRNHIKQVIETIAPHDSKERFEALGVKVISEEGKFLNEYCIETENHLIESKRIILATGSTAFIPQIPGLEKTPYLTNESIFDLEVLPRHLIIIGGGPIGIEMAQAFKRLGGDVSVLELFKALPKDEPSLTSALLKLLRQEGINIYEGIQELKIESSKGDITCTFLNQKKEETRLQGSHLLVATGRRPNIQSLNLEAGKIDYSAKGILVDDTLRTSNKRVYAIGDCIGGYQFTHVAGYHAGIALRNTIFKLGSKAKTNAIPWVTYTDPELAHVGALESDLLAQKIAYKKLELPFTECDRSQADRQIEGKIIAFTNPKGKILGISILGAHAGELLYPWVIAIENKLSMRDISNSLAPYPSRNDLTKQIAGSFYKEKIFGSTMRKIVKFLMAITR